VGGGKAETRNSKIENRNSKLKYSVLVKDMGVAPSDLRRTVRDFTDLEVWKAAREMRRQIYMLAKTLPDFEKFGLASQLRRAAVSVTANLAEGYGRFGYQENAQFCRQARGSIYELRDHIITCMDECFISARYKAVGIKLVKNR
jgi:four helix bundle protein